MFKEISDEEDWNILEYNSVLEHYLQSKWLRKMYTHSAFYTTDNLI